MSEPRHRVRRLATGATVLALVGSLSAVVAAVPAAAQPAFTWPEMHHDAQLTGASADPALSSSSASSLGVRWMTYTGSESLASPIDAFEPGLSKVVVFTGNEAGYLTAYAAGNGLPIWSVGLGNPIRSTPLAEGSFVWATASAMTGNRIYKLNGATGAVVCSTPLPLPADSSPTIATPPGGRPTVYVGLNDRGSRNGPLVAIDEATCTKRFSVSPAPPGGTGGIWDPISYGVDASGEGLVLFGTSDPDAKVYAVDAVTGATVWSFQTNNPPPGLFDVGAGVVVSPPGDNGIADGAVYVENKNSDLYSLDLTTGQQLWHASFAGDGESLSTPALSGTELVVGTALGMIAFNALNGAVLWDDNGATSVDGSPAIIGPAGAEVVAYGDLNGTVHVVALSTGAPLYTYQTGNFVAASVADQQGNLLVTSGDGYLYDFVAGGGQLPAPHTAVTSPAPAATVASPGGSLVVSGTATGATGDPVSAVTVAIQSGGSNGLWWNSVTGTWTTAPYPNRAVVTSPGRVAVTWQLSFPVPAQGGPFEVMASAVNKSGTADISATQTAATASRSSFTVSPSSSAPALTLSQPYVAPTGAVTVSGSGFGPGESVTLAIGGTSLGGATADGSGNLPATTVTVPAGIAFGPQAISATGQTSHSAAVGTIYVTNSWNQLGQGPAHQFSDPNDTMLGNHLSLSPSQFLSPAWSFNAGAPIASSPAVVNGVAYVADQAGAVYAVNVQTGAQVWRFQAPAGVAVDTTPAVDGGLVFVSTESGTLLALNAATGALASSTTISTAALESSPAVSNGVVYVGADDGTVAAVNESTGAAWRARLGGAVKASPTVDAGAGLVMVGDASGEMTALGATTGATAWRFSSGSPVTASALLLSGSLFFGAANGSFVALSESTGGLLWSLTLPGPVTAGASLVTPTQLAVGSADGTVTWTTVSGTVAFQFQVPGAVVGVGSSYRIDFTVSSTGTVTGSKPEDTNTDAFVTRLGSSLSAAPVVVNGVLFAPGLNGLLNTYAVPGSQPA